MRTSNLASVALGLIVLAVHPSAFADERLVRDDPILESQPEGSGLYAADRTLPVLLTQGTYTCTDAYGRVVESKLVVHADGLSFTFGNPSQDYTQNNAVNGGNKGEIGFLGSGGSGVVVTTGMGGQPPYTLTFKTADGAKFKYVCQ